MPPRNAAVPPAPPTPLLAVVTITKDDPVGIRRTLASVPSGDGVDLEHVVVDGGSDPEVADLLRTWQAQRPGRRRLVTDPPRGIYPSMNEGIRQTSAPLVLVLNGGDELVPGAIERVVADHAAHGWGWAYGGLVARDAEGRLLGNYVHGSFRRTRFRMGLDVVPHPASCVTRELYDEIGLYREDLGPSSDQEFFLRAATVSRPATIPGLLAVFWLGGVSGTEGLVGREVTWHRLRCAAGTPLGGGRTADVVVTGGLIALRIGLWAAAKVRRDPHPYLERGPVSQAA